MKELLRNVLVGWPELWRYPELLGVLVRRPDVEATEFGKALICGMASPRPPSEVFEALVGAGEFRTARTLLDRPGFRASLGGESLTGLTAEIDLARVNAQQEVEARVATLRHRAKAAGCSQDPPGGLRAALDVRWTRAELLVDDWEAEIEQAESERASELTERLRTLSGESPAPSLEVTAWQESVNRCIEARRLDAALFLLEGGPSEPLPDEPLAVPKRPEEWFRDYPPRTVLGWINDTLPAPPDFKAWRSQPGDEEADAIARVLTRIVERTSGSGEGGEPMFADAQEVEEFAEAMDRFLGYGGERTRQVLELDSGYETRLYGLEDSRLPCLAVYGEGGVRLRLPRTQAEDRPEPDSDGDVLLCFGLTPAAPMGRGIVSFDVYSLLRLFSGRHHRRVNFLREIGARLHPLDAIPADSHRIQFEKMDIGAIRSYASWLFDILNVDVEEPELVDMMVYYSGARADLLLWLMRALLERTDGRRETATPAGLLKAWRGLEFRATAARALLQPLENDPRARAVLGAALFAGLEPGGTFDRDEVGLVLDEFEDAAFAEVEAQTLLERLVGLDLLAARAAGEYFIPRSGIGHLLVESIPDVEQYVRDSLRAAR